MRLALCALACACAAVPSSVPDARLTCADSTVRAVPVSPAHAVTSLPALGCDSGAGWWLSDTSGDMALVGMDREVFATWAITTGAPRVGQSVCGVLGYRHRWECGRVVEAGDGYVVAHLPSTHHGDSGSGVYRNGRLIGVVIGWVGGDPTRTRIALVGTLADGLPRVCLLCEEW